MLSVRFKKSVLSLAVLALSNAASVVRAETKEQKPAPQAAENVRVEGKSDTPFKAGSKQGLFAGAATAQRSVPATLDGEAAVEKLQVGAAAAVRPMSATEQAKVLEESRKVKANIELWSQRIRGKLAEVQKRLDTLDLRQIESQKMLVEDFVDILDEVDDEAQAIEQAYSAIRGEYGLWADALAKAPDSFRAVAAVFEGKAADQIEASLKIHYADFAAVARDLAKKYESKSSETAAGQRQLERQMIFVGNSREFIRDVRSLLDAVPATEEGVEVELFCKRLNEYIKVFEASIKMLKGMADQLGEDKKPEKPASQPSAAAKAVPVKALTPEEYQAKLAALRRR